MKTEHDQIRARLLAGLDTTPPGHASESLEELASTQWDPHFEQLMRNRLIMGRFRYGSIPDQRTQGNGYDNIGSAIKRLELYQKTGNMEHLVDVASLCLMEFTAGNHPNRHFNAADDTDIHVEKL